MSDGVGLAVLLHAAKMLVSTCPLLILCVLVTKGEGTSVSNDLTVRVLYIGGDTTPEAINQAQAAQHYINSNSVLPSGYRLQIIDGESKVCNRKETLDTFYSNLFNESIHAVIAGVCPFDTEILAAVTQYYYLTLISFTTSSTGPDEEELYPYHFHIVPALSYIACGIADFLTFREFDWQRVVVITQDQKHYKKTTELLTATLADRNFTVQGNILLSEGLTSVTADTLFVPDSRIYVLNVDSTLARIIFCQVLNAGLQQYRYVWIIPGTYEEGWLGENITQTNFNYECRHSIGEIERFVHEQRVIAINHYPPPNPNTSDSVSTTSYTKGKSITDEINALAYDSVLTVAKSLKHVSSHSDFNINDFDPLEASEVELVSRQIGRTIRDSMRSISFHGRSGEVTFKNQSRLTNVVRILQYRNESGGSAPNPVGVINLNIEDFTESLIFNEGESVTNLWPEGVPMDGKPIPTINYPLLPVVIVSYLYAGAVIICAVLCLIFTVIFRKRKLIRLTSPNLNYIIGVGVVVFSLSVFMFVYPPLSIDVLVYHCGIRSWFAAIGYSLCFGTINTKMWRVYYIFHDIKPTSNKKAIKDWHLLLVVSLFIAVDVVILTIVTPLTSTRLKPEIVPDKEFGSTVNENGITVNYEVILCESRYKTLWLVVLFGYKVIVQVIGVFLAYKIRKVKIKVLNDSKEVAVTLYITSLILAAVIIITVVFDDYQNVYSTMYSLGIPLSSSVVLGVVYVSKMVRLYKDPKGDTIFTHVTNDATGAVSAAGTGFATCDDHDRVINLEKKVKDLQAQLAACEGKEVLPSADMFSSLTFENESHKNDLSGRKKQVRIKVHNDNNLQQNSSLS